jgi:hypothetical protein
MYQYWMNMPSHIQNSPEGEKFLRCCGGMANVLVLEENFPFKDEYDNVFDWKCFKDREKMLERKHFVHRLESYKERKGAFNDEGCFIASIVKKYCG